VKDALPGRRWVRDITGALTATVLSEFVQLWTRLQDVQLRPLESDRFVWRWSTDGQYSIRSVYRAYFVGWTAMAGAKELWHAVVPPKVKFFFWMVLHGRLWTADRRKRHGLQLDAACVLCDQLDETTDHLLCSCVFSCEVWSRLLHALAYPAVAHVQDSTLLDWWLLARARIPRALRRSFDSLVLLVSWLLWKERNRRTFDHRSMTAPELLRCISEEANVWIVAGYRCLALLTAMAA
jgi:hypothetical protein